MAAQSSTSSSTRLPGTLSLEAVRGYANKGWPVIPLYSRGSDGLCDCGNPECEAQAKHPRTIHGLKDASANLKAIEAWGKKWPKANWAVVTGLSSGLIVLDIDGDTGKTSIANYQVPLSFYVSTSRGWHGYFKLPAGITYKSAVNLLPGVDIRAEGGYVVAPPSIHITGKRYEILCDETITYPPAWLVELLVTKSASVPCYGRKDVFEVGERNAQLFHRGCGFVRTCKGNRKRLEGWLLAANRNRCKIPLEVPEVQTITTNVLSIYNKMGRQGLTSKVSC